MNQTSPEKQLKSWQNADFLPSASNLKKKQAEKSRIFSCVSKRIML